MIDLPPAQPHFEIVAASEGMSKGLAQTEGGQPLGRIELASGDISVGAQLKNISSPSADAESAAFIGLRRRAGRLEIGGSVSYKRWLWTSGPGDGEAVEFGLTASRPVGPVRPRVILAYSPDELGSTGASLFADLNISARLSQRWSLGVCLGRRERALAADYTAFNAGATLEPDRRFAIDLRYYDSDRSGRGRAYAPRLVLSLRARL